MEKTGEGTGKKTGQATGLLISVLLGGLAGLVLLLLLTLLVAGLIWGGVLPEAVSGGLLTGLAGLCAFIGGRIAIRKGGDRAMVVGSCVGGLLCLVLLAVCLGSVGATGLHGQFFGILLMLLAGGGLAGLLGPVRHKSNKKKKR